MSMNAQLYGKYKGICTNNQDPEGLLRIKVKIPGLFDEEIEEWALPCITPATEYTDDGNKRRAVQKPPEEGQGVWVEFEAGDENAPIWAGVWYDRSRRPAT